MTGLQVTQHIGYTTLEGFDSTGLNNELIDDIINNPWDYNFPCTLEEYNK